MTHEPLYQGAAALLLSRLPRAQIPPPGPATRPTPLWLWRHDILRKSYNGFPGHVRVRMYQVWRWAIQAGMLPFPLTCSICGLSKHETRLVWGHSENYFDPAACLHVCGRCHHAIHARTGNPALLARLVEQHGDGTRWFEALTAEPLDLFTPAVERYGETALDPFANPFFAVPAEWLAYMTDQGRLTPLPRPVRRRARPPTPT